MTELSPEQRVAEIQDRWAFMRDRPVGTIDRDITFLLDTLEAALQREAKLREALGWFTKDHDPRCQIHHGGNIEGRVLCDCGMLKARELLATLSDQPTKTGEDE